MLPLTEASPVPPGGRVIRPKGGTWAWPLVEGGRPPAP